MSGTHTLTATATGLTQATSSAFTVSVSTPSALHPNEPVGMTETTNQPWNAVPPTTSALPDLYGWYVEAGLGRLSIVSDLTAPFSPSNVLRGFFPDTMDGGTSPFSTQRLISGTAVKRLYLHWWMWIDPNWTNNGTGVGTSAGVKFGWTMQKNGANHYINFIGGNTGTGQMFGTGLQFASPYTTPGNRNINGPITASSRKGMWLNCEWLGIQNSSPGVGDGQVYQWVDGVLNYSATNVIWSFLSNQNYFSTVRISPTYGGAPSTVKPPTGGIYFLIDHMYASTGT